MYMVVVCGGYVPVCTRSVCGVCVRCMRCARGECGVRVRCVRCTRAVCAVCACGVCVRCVRCLLCVRAVCVCVCCGVCSVCEVWAGGVCVCVLCDLRFEAVRYRDFSEAGALDAMAQIEGGHCFWIEVGGRTTSEQPM